MANELTLPQNSSLATAQRAFGDSDFTKSIANDSLKRISIKGGVFRMMSGKSEVASLDERSMKVVVVGAAPHVHREFYPGAYQEGVDVQPACWSSNGFQPDAAATDKQAAKCDSCPKNQKGSAASGPGKACRYAQRVAVVLANDLDGEVYGMKLPAMSVFGEQKNGYAPFRAYATFLASAKVPMPSVVTEMKFDKDSAVPKLMFKAAQEGYIGDENVDTIRRQMQRDEVKKHIELKVFVKEGEGSETPAPKAAATPAPKMQAPVIPAASASAMADAISGWQADDGKDF